MSESRCDSPRAWGVMGSADWESPGAIPPGKRHPYPGELEFMYAESIKSAGPCNRSRDCTWWRRKVSRLFYALCVQRRIYIEGM